MEWLQLGMSVPNAGGVSRMALVLWVLCTPVQFIVASVFYRDAYFALRNKSPDMSVLIVLGKSIIA